MNSSSSSTSSTSSSSTSTTNHKCYDLCEHWTKEVGCRLAQSRYGKRIMIDCEEFELKEELRITNKGW